MSPSQQLCFNHQYLPMMLLFPYYKVMNFVVRDIEISVNFYGQKTSGGNKKGENTFSSKGRGFPQTGQKSPLSPPHQSQNQDAQDKPSVP